MTGQHKAVFTWPNTEPSTVIVTGSFDNWAAKDHHLIKGANSFEGEVLLDWDKAYEFKYVVDGNWLTRDDVDKEWDASGNMNNVYKSPSAPVPEPEPAVPAVLASEAPGPGTSVQTVVDAPLTSNPPSAPAEPAQTASEVKAEALASEAPALSAAVPATPVAAAEGEDIAASAQPGTSSITSDASSTPTLQKAGEEVAATLAGAAAAVTAAGVAAAAYLNPKEVSADSKGASLKDALAPVTGDHVTNFTASEVASESGASTNGFVGKPNLINDATSSHAEEFEHVVEPIKEPAVLVKAPVEEKFEQIEKGEVVPKPAVLSAYAGTETPKASAATSLPEPASAFSTTIPAPAEGSKGEDIAKKAFPEPSTPSKKVATEPVTADKASEENAVPGSYPIVGIDSAPSTPASSAPNSPATKHLKEKAKDLKRKSGVFGKIGSIFKKDK